jgi:hypothetical protein
MTNAINARLSRLERKALSDNPLDAMSDEDLNQAIEVVTRRIEAHTGMSIANVNARLAQQLADGELPQDIDVGLARRYLAADKALEATRAALDCRA